MSDDLDGQKAITPDNFAQPDSRILYFFSDRENWLKRCHSSVVVPQVPENVAALLRTARGTISYAWFYYPLLTLGAEQCTRCLEAAARECCKNVGIVVENTDKKGKLRPVHFGNLLAALIDRGLLTNEDAGRWDVGRDLRNMAAHPGDQMIFTPGQALGLLDTTIELINRLFAK
jgi:hypothetical protein